MIPKITVTDREQELENLVVVISRMNRLPGGMFNASEKDYILHQVEQRREDLICFNRLTYRIYVAFIREEKDFSRRMERCRTMGDTVAGELIQAKAQRAAIFDPEGLVDEALSLAEGMMLGSYRFLKYMTSKEKASTLTDIELYSKALMEKTRTPKVAGADELNILTDAIYRCRDMINEPNSHMTATVFSAEAESMSRSCGIAVETMNRSKLEALKMGGILAVNKGSKEPPTFTVMEWNPPDKKNQKPFVLVGKGVMYDTGGMNLKPGDSMLNMKDDMSGAATVAAVVYAVARARLPLHVVGLMPATDNRPGPGAMVSGDVLIMHNGMTVEVINTDAEGRLLLADALSYARKYDPALVIDLATLTGSAVRAIGKFGAAAMQSDAGDYLAKLMVSGNTMYERLVEFPMWEEYGRQIESEIADLKNLGPPEAGLITAAKFLQKFTTYPYIHLDIAGPAFLEKRDSYRGQGATGFGVRLLFDFLRRFVG